MEITGSVTIGGGRYRLLSRLGRGEDTVVYEAMDQHGRQRCALKVLLPHAARRANHRARFEAGAQALSRLRHPHLVWVSEVVADGPLPFLAMELVPGGTLAGWLERHGPMPPWRAVRCALQVASALAVTHEAGIVHGGVEPHDVLLAMDGTCRLGVFRIASGLERALDPRIDVAGLGRTLWALLIGRPPPEHADPAALSTIPPLLRGVIQRSVSPQLQARPRTMLALSQQLQGHLKRLLPQGPTPELEPILIHGQPDAFGEIACLLDNALGDAPSVPEGFGSPPDAPEPPSLSPSTPAPRLALPPLPPPALNEEGGDSTFLEELANVVQLGMIEVLRVVVPPLVMLALLGALLLGVDQLQLYSVTSRLRDAQGELDGVISAEQPVLQELVGLGADPEHLRVLWDAWATAPDAASRAKAALILVDELALVGSRLQSPGVEGWHSASARLERLKQAQLPLIDQQRSLERSRRSIPWSWWRPDEP